VREKCCIGVGLVQQFTERMLWGGAGTHNCTNSPIPHPHLWRFALPDESLHAPSGETWFAKGRRVLKRTTGLEFPAWTWIGTELHVEGRGVVARAHRPFHYTPILPGPNATYRNGSGHGGVKYD